MIVNGVKVRTKEELELAIVNLSEESKTSLRSVFSQWASTNPSERNQIKYAMRASVKDKILVEMATENMERVRAGIWSTPQLIALTQDAELKLVQDDLNSLSFELAVMKLQTISNPLITPEIKAGWIQKVMKHFYNDI